MTTTTHIITGATGLVGSALVLELGTRTDARLICLVRTHGHDDARTRLRGILRSAAHAYLVPPAQTERILRRVTVIPGIDLTADLRGLPLPAGTGRTEFWHCAARMLFRERERRGNFATNAAGTRRALTLAEQLRTTAFNLISTAYVAGRAQGTVTEQAITDPQGRNPYERSKMAAERIALTANGRMFVRILRPSIIVGHSTTLRYVAKPAGAYSGQSLIAAFYRTAGRSFRHEPCRIQVTPDEPFNIVPIDHVVREAVDISQRPSASGVFHLTNPTPPSTGDFIRACVANAGGAEPRFVQDSGWLSPRDRVLHDMLSVYHAHINNCQHFDRTRCDAAVVDPSVAAWHLAPETLRGLFRPFAQRRPSAHTD
ncbi:SDR family oxidoreductase [Streptomyces sp. NPDC127068]|uniref:SDR family oxidoreductase n=1 Tax=Streptomyces sp. NPDC127068 TaxID=3347127 RepID=UPI00365F4414